MIGWRPYLLTGVAIVLLAAVGFDVASTARQHDACASATRLAGARDFAAARTSYDSVLKIDANSACARVGLANATSAECVQAQRIATTDPDEAHNQLLDLAESMPLPGPRSCVWFQLAAVAKQLAHKTSS
jgi:hypothetical protein